MMVNRSAVTLLPNTFLVFNIGKVLQRLVLHGKSPGVLFLWDVKDACMSKAQRFLGRQKTIIGGEVKIAFRCSKLRRGTWWRLVVGEKKFRLRWYVTITGMRSLFLLRLQCKMQSPLDMLMGQWISMSSSCSGYPCFSRYCFNSWDFTTKLSFSEQTLRSLSTWLNGIAVLQCFEWKLFVCKY